MNDTPERTIPTQASGLRPVVYVARPRCPACGSTRLRSYRSTQVDEATLIRYTACRDCGQRFLLVVE